MVDLNDQDAIKKLDPKDVYDSTGMFADQCSYIWELSKSVAFDEKYKKAKEILICGMGGSAYGAYVVPNLFKEELTVSVINNNDYTLPGYINKNSLVILSSYSGTTEEVLSAGKYALEKGLYVVTLTGGGKLAEMGKTDNFPALVFDQKFNPSGQPRLGTGYMVFGTIAMLTRLGYLSITDEDVKKEIDTLKRNAAQIKAKAKELAQKVYGYIPVIFSAEHLTGNIHIMRNQFNETAKSFSSYSELPELNHHLMEGLKNPQDKKLKIFFINSELYSDKLKKRLALTKDVVGKNNIEWIEYQPISQTEMGQMLEVLSLGGYVTFYLAILYEQDPSLIPWVDYFKEQLTK